MNKKCPVCSVEITPENKVLFSYGKPGTLEKLHCRVCKYAKKPGCINTMYNEKKIVDSDYYLDPPKL